jgi:hypothetical protein
MVWLEFQSFRCIGNSPCYGIAARHLLYPLIIKPLTISSFVAVDKPIDLMCRLLGVTRSGYYGYHRRHDDEDDLCHQDLLEAVRDLAKASDYSYGSRRMKKALNILSYPVSRNKARKLNKEAGVQVKRRKKYKVTTNSNHKQHLCNRLQRFSSLSFAQIKTPPLSMQGLYLVEPSETIFRKRLTSIVAFFHAA